MDDDLSFVCCSTAWPCNGTISPPPARVGVPHLSGDVKGAHGASRVHRGHAPNGGRERSGGILGASQVQGHQGQQQAEAAKHAGGALASYT